MAKDDKKKSTAVEAPPAQAAVNTVQAGAQGPRKPRPAGSWVKMSEDDLKEHQKSGKLLGYDSATGEGLLKEDK